MQALLKAVNRNASASGLGFAGATGLLASGLTDIASTLGPFLTWFVVVGAVGAMILAVLIHRHERRRSGESKDPQLVRVSCHAFVVLLGSLFGSGVLILSGLFTQNSDGSHIIALLNDIKSGIDRVEQQVGEISEDVQGLGESITVRDLSGRSGTGRIGENAVFAISLANERMMAGATCRLRIAPEWQDLVSVLDPDCSAFTVRLPDSPVLGPNGNFAGDIVSIPVEIEVLDAGGSVVASYEYAYPLHNNYGEIAIVVDPPGNRLGINQERSIRVDVGTAELPDSVECDWTAFDPVTITPTSDNRCKGVLSTAVDPEDYVSRRLEEEGEIRDEVYVQLNTVADFSMLGNATWRFVVSR